MMKLCCRHTIRGGSRLKAGLVGWEAAGAKSRQSKHTRKRPPVATKCKSHLRSRETSNPDNTHRSLI
uniref:Uncharacterized protein n=1 Tax=Anopheles dirus TaxID=7168 RepID=A0A182NXW3_9DIPT